MIHEERDCVAGGWQVLDNVEQHDNVGCAEPPKKGLVGLTGQFSRFTALTLAAR